MLICTAKLKSAAPYSQSKPVEAVKISGETPDAYEQRTWPLRIHKDKQGQCFIPPNAIKNAIVDVAKYLSQTIAGKGKATFTKHFKAGTMVYEPLLMHVNGSAIMADDVKAERLFLPSDGVAGSGKRVWKMYPVFESWEATAVIVVVDPVLLDKPEKVQEYVEQAGRFIGLGRFRPINNGWYGRYTLDDWKVEK